MWVLRTNTTLPTKDVALTYKQLWMVEEMFRSMMSLLTTRLFRDGAGDRVLLELDQRLCDLLEVGAAQNTEDVESVLWSPAFGRASRSASLWSFATSSAARPATATSSSRGTPASSAVRRIMPWSTIAASSPFALRATSVP